MEIISQYPSLLILVLAHVFLGFSAMGLVWYEKLRNVSLAFQT